MKILAIDPGPELCGMATIYSEADGRSYRIAGSVVPVETVLQRVQDEGIFRINLLAVEFPQAMGMPASQAILDTAAIAGVILHIATAAQKIRVKRTEVKLHLCGTARAKDANVRRALLDRWGEKGTKKNPGPTFSFSKDAWAALAVATYALDTVICNIDGQPKNYVMGG